MNHYNSSPIEKEEKLREATQVCIDGLLDEATHLSKTPPELDLYVQLTSLQSIDLPFPDVLQD